MSDNLMRSAVLTSETGFEVDILNFGGIIRKIMALGKDGQRHNVVLHYQNNQDYYKNPMYLGCVIGPVAGRTQNGYISDTMQLDTSLDKNSLHSGADGLHRVFWKIEHQSKHLLKLSHEVKSNTNHIQYHITYSVQDDSLTIAYEAMVLEPTYLSLTNHSYFNLSGHHDQSILDHTLSLQCSHVAILDEASLPIKLQPIEQSDLNITFERLISEIQEIDHPFKCLPEKVVAELKCYEAGICLRVQTTQPYMVVYSGIHLKDGFLPYSGICFETQDLPNVTNSRLDAFKLATKDSPYSHTTTFSFLAL